jgi:hypothetical protein
MRDASLDDFLSGSDEDEEPEGEELESEAGSEPDVEAGPEAEAEAEPDTESEVEPEPEVEADAEPATADDPDPEDQPPVAEVDPARSTFAWSPDGATCAACGESVEERWESEAGLVCVECKAW